MVKSLTLRLSWPPTVNHYYGRRKNGQVFLKEAGRLYRRKAAVEFARLGWPRLEGKVSVHLVLVPPNRLRRDIDNIRKAVYDALSDRRGHTGVIADDSLIVKDAAEFAEPGEGIVEIRIVELCTGV